MNWGVVLNTQYKLIIEPFTLQCQFYMTLRKKSFENIGGKWENAGNQYFVPFP